MSERLAVPLIAWMVAAFAALFMAADPADAHTAKVSVNCDVTGTFVYESFPFNSQAYTAIWIDGKLAQSGTATGLGQSQQTRTLSVPFPVDGKSHQVYAATHWTADNGGYEKSVTLTCPPINPPTPTPTPTPPAPTPTPEPPVVPPTPPVHVADCAGKPLVPGVAASKCPSPPKCPDTGANRYKIVVTPKHATHGRVTFRLKGPHVRKVRWYVDLKRRGVNGVRWETLSGKGDRIYRVYLFSKEVWGPALWGEHWVTVRVTVGPKGCGHSVSKKLKFFNNDPPLGRG